MTVDPENIKAVLATQFDDFGKGEEFHAAWKFVTLRSKAYTDAVSGRWNI